MLPDEDDDVTTPDTEAEPEGEEQEVTEAEPEEGDGEEGEEEEAEPEELDEIEHEGKKHAIPKALKPLFMMQSDYTKKTQEVADTRRELEARQTAFQEHTKAQEAFIGDFAKIEALNGRIAEFEKVDWQTLSQQDAPRAQALWFEFSRLKDQRVALSGGLRQKIDERSQAQRRDHDKRVEESQAVLRKEIPNFGPELVSKLRDFGMTQAGLTQKEVDAVIDPRHVKLLYLAHIGHELAEKQRKAMTKPKPTEAKPVPTVQAKGKTDSRLRDDLSIEEWTKRRDAQERAARAR
jgi:hypothetical protein